MLNVIYGWQPKPIEKQEKGYRVFYNIREIVEKQLIIDDKGDESETEMVSYLCDFVEVDNIDYKILVEAMIRNVYTISGELAILRQRDEKKEEFDAYYQYAEQCKAYAKEIISN